MAIANLIIKDNTDAVLNTYTVDCNNVSIGWSNSIDAKPYANSLSAGVSEVQKNGFENPMYTLQGVVISGRANTLSYNALVDMAKMVTSSSDNYLVLEVDYGISTNVPLVDSAKAASGIKVVLKSFNFNLGLNRRFEDSDRSMGGTIVLQESS